MMITSSQKLPGLCGEIMVILYLTDVELSLDKIASLVGNLQGEQ